MMGGRIIHFIEPEYDDALCGRPDPTRSGVTMREDQVTCRDCLRLLAKGQDRIAHVVREGRADG